MNTEHCSFKLKFHGTDTDTDSNTDFLADFRGARGSRPAAARAARSARRLVRGLLSDTLAFPREDVCWGARVYTCTCAVHDKLSCTRLHDRGIPNVGVGVRVGPVEFKLYSWLVWLLFTASLAACQLRLL